MFGRVITKIFKRGAPVAKPATAQGAKHETQKLFGRKSAPPASEGVEPKTRSSEPAADTVKQKWASKAAETLDPKASAETLCGVNTSMAKEEIKEKLAVLYRRHNRAASSLDAKMREEAEIMLEAIASMKEKYLGKK
jgi:hypothetical protein